MRGEQLFTLSHDFSSLFLVAIEGEQVIDVGRILRINDVGRHHGERFQPFVVKGENLHQSDSL